MSEDEIERYLVALMVELTYLDYEPDQPVLLDSLLAVEVKVRVESDLAAVIPLVDYLEGLTLRELAQRLATAETLDASAAGPLQLPTLTPTPEDRHLAFPLNDIQEAYWLGRQAAFDLGNIATHFYTELEAASLDIPRLQDALNACIRRHEMLRAVITDRQQQILPTVPDYEIQIVDVADASTEVVEATLAETRERWSHEVRPVDHWPLFDVVVIKLPDAYRLVITIDLLIADGLGVGILMQDWATFYDDPQTQQAPLELSFRDYVLAAGNLEATSLYQRARDYWLRRLPTLPPAPVLPLAKSLSSIGEPRFSRHTARIDAARWAALKAAAVERGLTPSVVLCAAYAEVLGRWAKSPRFTVNITVADRLPIHPEVGQIVGNFTSVILLEVDTGLGASFEERARALQAQLWQDLEHRYFSGVRVLRELARAQRATTATMPVVFSGVLARSYPRGNVSTRPGAAEAVYGISQTPQVYLDNQVLEDEDGSIAVNWDGIAELIPDGLFDDMLSTYGDLLVRLADDATTWTADDPLRLPASQVELFDAMNATTVESDDDRLHDLFAQSVDRDAERVAVVDATRRLSYAQLDEASGAVAARLQDLGVQGGELVAVVMAKGWEQVAAALGAVRARAAYLPIDPTLPTGRIANLVERGEARVVLTQAPFATVADWPTGVTVVVVDDDLVIEAADGWKDGPGAPEDLAYVLFTSGSTGRPKGVMVPHRGPANTVAYVNRTFGVGPDDRVLGLSALGFDLSVYDLFGSLAAGAALILPEPAGTRDPLHWADLVATHGVTVWNSVPALAQMFVDHLETNPRSLPSLRLVLLSGDWIPVGLPDRLRAALPGVVVVSLGGPTETSIWNICHPVGAVDPTWSSIPYGRPIDNQRIYVLDEQLHQRPVWVSGELCCAGTGLADGYWRDEQRTGDAFVTHPATGERLYRTGDLGRVLPDGTIHLDGRRDYQFKLHGYRVEPGEIEAALTQHPAVRAATVIGYTDAQGARRICAYLVSSEPTSVDVLRSFLRDRLPMYMVPAVFMFVDALPLTANGKVDRDALPEPRRHRAGEHEPVAPATPTEELVQAIWREVLDLPSVSGDDDFFESGGDSLLALAICAKAAEAGLDLQPRQIFEYPTIAEQASLLDQRPVP